MGSLRAVLLCIVTSAANGSEALPKALKKHKLNRVSFLFAHDAGTGYLGSRGAGVVDGWTKTQSAGFSGQFRAACLFDDASPTRVT